MYRNHICRLINFSWCLEEALTTEQREKIIISACFHDLGIWSHRTFNYLKPSVLLAKEYLERHKLDQWQNEIAEMIQNHHKIKPFREEKSSLSLIELFRKADWIDVTLGLLQFGLSSEAINKIQKQYPNAGFHRRLIDLTFKEFMTHPLKPLPMMKW